VQENLRTSVSRLETQLSTLQAELATARADREAATQHVQQLEASAAHSRTEFDALRQQNEVLDERACDAESRVRMLLDQFESSVDNYRRQSQIPVGAAAVGINGGHHRAGNDSVSGDKREPSTYEAMTRAFMAVDDRNSAMAVVNEGLSRGYPAAVAGKILELVGGGRPAVNSAGEATA